MGNTSPAPFEIDGADTRREYKKHPQARQRMYILYILWLRVRNANSILRGTTAIRGGSNTLRIFSSNVLLLAKLASLSGKTA